MVSRITASALFLGVLTGSFALAAPFSADDLVRLDRVGAPVLSPDGKSVVYTLRTTDMEANKGRFDLWISPVQGGEPRQLTSNEANETSPAWSPDGAYVYFLSSRDDSSQVWRIPAGDGDAARVTNLPVDVGTFRLSPDGSLLLLSAEVYLDCEDLECTAARDKAKAALTTTGMSYDQLFMRHWDRWLGDKRSRLFAVPLQGGQATREPVLVSKAVDADVPSRIWGGNEEYVVSADGATVYFAARIRDAEEPLSTNFDIYSAPANGDGPTLNLTEANRAWDTQPVLSPDGDSLAYLSMTRPGFESDRYRIMIRDLESGETREVAPEWDYSAASIAFSPDGKGIIANAQDTGNKTLWGIDIESGDAQRFVEEGSVSAFDVGGNEIVFARNSLKSPDELFALNFRDGKIEQLTNFSGPQLADVEMGDFEQFSFVGANDEVVYGYVVKPANFEAGETYPVSFLIHGGPQGSFGNQFHYRWNPQTYAGQGFAAVFIDFHGSTGYGQDFTDSITENWGDEPLLDLQLGLAAALAQYDFLDGDNVCALGASYGGYMINWIAGNWPERFDCLVNHDGIFDNRMMAYTTEELWFVEWEHGGPYFENPELQERYNPVNFVDEWQTPMLVIHGELDFRVPVTQGIAAFTALQRRGIESRFLYFPDENHWVLKPANSVQWHNAVNEWLHRYLD